MTKSRALTLRFVEGEAVIALLTSQGPRRVEELAASLQALAGEMEGEEQLEEPDDRTMGEVRTAMDDAFTWLE